MGADQAGIVIGIELSGTALVKDHPAAYSSQRQP